VYLLSSGKLSRSKNTLVLETKNGKEYLPIENISEIAVMGDLDLNKRLLEFLTTNKILLHFFNYYGYYIGSYYPREYYNSGYLTLKQSEHYLDINKRMTLARLFVMGSANNMLQVLKYYNTRGKDLKGPIEIVEEMLDDISRCDSTDALMATEGNIRRVYYSTFNEIVGEKDFQFEERTRQPPKNRMNSLISFGNSILYTLCLSEIYHTHLDPRIGFLHSTNYRRFTLNLDVAEVFKPVLVDRLILRLINRGQVKNNHFRVVKQGVFLNDNGKKIFIQEWEKQLGTTIYHKELKRKVSYRRLIRLELYKLEKHLIGESSYIPFKSRW